MCVTVKMSPCVSALRPHAHPRRGPGGSAVPGGDPRAATTETLVKRSLSRAGSVLVTRLHSPLDPMIPPKGCGHRVLNEHTSDRTPGSATSEHQEEKATLADGRRRRHGEAPCGNAGSAPRLGQGSLRARPVSFCLGRRALFPALQAEEALPAPPAFSAAIMPETIGCHPRQHILCCCHTELITSVQRAEWRRPGARG